MIKLPRLSWGPSRNTDPGRLTPHLVKGGKHDGGAGGDEIAEGQRQLAFARGATRRRPDLRDMDEGGEPRPAWHCCGFARAPAQVVAKITARIVRQGGG